MKKRISLILLALLVSVVVVALAVTDQEARQDVADGHGGKFRSIPADPGQTGYNQLYWLRTKTRNLGGEWERGAIVWYECRLRREGPDLDGDGTADEKSRLTTWIHPREQDGDDF